MEFGGVSALRAGLLEQPFSGLGEGGGGGGGTRVGVGED